ncbi:type IV toxin-antitoxin system AbiEi family antitoxin domain-containing protein [Carnobacterium sp. TMP28]|uniref:type IV toxin-antitoxin system AbiEi family antitoxin domain-containing protein n=1 Tax=Carnobacterium sp. TMP28 TaxID=3397060 RepID=UPI0039E10AA8
MDKFEIMDKIVQRNDGYIRTSEATKNDISRTHFLKYVETKHLIRVAHGIYMTEDTWQDDMYITQIRYSEAIFSHETAAYLLQLTDREPFELSLTLKAGKSSTSLIKSGVTVYKIKEKLFEVGLISLESPTGHKIRSYNDERTICDLIRNRSSIEIQEIQSALKTYLRKKDRNIPKLMKYSKLFSVDSIISQYMEVLL